MQSIYFKTAWRNLWKKKFYTGINLLGLSIASAAFLLLICYVTFERSYENFHQQANNIYRVTLNLYKGSEFVVTDCETHPPLAAALKNQMPEVRDVVRIQNLGTSELKGTDKPLLSSKAFAADPSVFSIFSYHLLKGNPLTALAAPNQVVITESMAKKLYGNANVIGKSLLLNGTPTAITGVLENVPANTHLRFDLLLSFPTLVEKGFDLNSWDGNNNYTYLLMQPNTNLAQFNSKLKAFSLNQKQIHDRIFTAEPITDIHLYSHKTFEPDVNGNAKTVNYLFLIAILILVIGSANYINLTTARSGEKQKESGIRRILGSTRTGLAGLFFTESFIINLLAIAGALILVKLATPLYASIAGYDTAHTLFRSHAFWIALILLFVLNNVLSGLYPAFVLSKVKAVVVTQRSFTSALQGNLLRKTLVVAQFAIAIIVFTSSVIIYQQLYFVKHQQLGMNINQVLTIKGPDLTGNDSLNDLRTQVFKNELAKIPGVAAVSMTNSLPGLPLSSLSTQTGVRRWEETRSPGYNYYLYSFDADFIPLLDMQMAAGENFVKGLDNKGKVIINETACSRLGFASAASAIGRKIRANGQEKTVAGVVKDYHQQSLKEAHLPMIHWFSNGNPGFFALKLQSADMPKILAHVQQAWASSFADHVFDYAFLDDTFNQQYKEDVQFGKMINLFAALTLLITCLGLLGLTTFNTARRTREIGVRKVLGASAQSIVTLLSKDFLQLILIAIVIAIPASWLAMNKWLQNFTYKIHISWWVFAFTGILTIALALLTISLQSIKAAMANPAKSLKTE
ncbi:putative ABC transport system permease protein [Filimonas lacunae]|uniref:Putative ABC transport system permease protein n=1 Tax=Filimonas lacunae TaxID=477680 RepID=A0A173MCG1_9BACT|nr:ABC transporter permease [Filimonas lacunae]BAV05148.1 ABC transporter, permease protein [Filimonas lacunae]SIT34151.1 putative ABC transport system permease protein [Filimonas lacunae]